MGKIKDGFLQDPKSLEYKGKLYHLEDILTHIESKNKFQIKEIQAKGLVVIVTDSIQTNPIGVRAYIFVSKFRRV